MSQNTPTNNVKVEEIIENPSVKKSKKKKTIKSSRSSKTSLEQVFKAIVSFVNDLWETFGSKKVNPFALYHRLLEHVQPNDEGAMMKFIGGFDKFLLSHEKEIFENQLDKIPKGEKIYFNNNKDIYIDIQKYIYQSDDESNTIICQHLSTISILRNPRKESMKKFEELLSSSKSEKGGFSLKDFNIDENTTEGKFVKNIVEKAQTTMDSINTDNPMAAMAGIYKSGILTDLMEGIQDGLDSKKLNARKLFKTMKGALNALVPDDIEDDEPQEELSRKDQPDLSSKKGGESKSNNTSESSRSETEPIASNHEETTQTNISSTEKL
jgi:hypothetical protein